MPALRMLFKPFELHFIMLHVCNAALRCSDLHLGLACRLALPLGEPAAWRACQ